MRSTIHAESSKIRAEETLRAFAEIGNSCRAADGRADDSEERNILIG